jgi:hypothetical protein
MDIRKREKGEVVNPYAMVIGSDNIFVIPYAEARIDQDGTVEFYDHEKHKGKLTCPECQLPRLTFRKASGSSGDTGFRRDHFARYKGEEHDLHCEVGLRALEYPGQDRVIDSKKAPYVYLNTGKISARPPYKSQFNRAASYIPPQLRLLPAWIQAIDFTANSSRDYPTIQTPDFKDRARLNPIVTIQDYLRILKTLPASKLSDTWVINNGVAVRFDKTIIREGANSLPRNENELQSIKEDKNLPKTFPLALDGKYDRFSGILDECLQGIRHPVLLHFKVESNPTKMNGDNGTRLRVTLPSFRVQNPEREKLNHPPLELPEISVYRYVHIKDQTVFTQIKQGQEYFAIAHPYVFKDSGENGSYNLHFDILRASDITQMTQQELADAIKKASERRVAQAQRKAAKQNSAEAIPA